MGFKLEGITEMQNRARALKRGLPGEIKAALYQETSVEGTEVERRTPVWNPDRPLPRGTTAGALRGSVRVKKPVQEGNVISCTIVVGGPDAAYAVVVHEDLEAIHATGEPKFVESVIRESASTIGARIAARIDFNRAAKE